MKCRLIFEQSTRDSTFLEIIQSAVNDVVEEVNDTSLPEHSVEVRVAIDCENVIPETGSGGWTETPNKIWVYFDDTSKNFLKNPNERIRSAVAHEFGHAFRELEVPFPGTLLDDLVAEGLADHLDLALVGGEGKPWSHAVDRNGFVSLFSRAKVLFNERDYDYFGWFMGSEELKLPKWGGYSLGFDIVEKYLNKTNFSVVDAIHLESEKFIEDYSPTSN